jgi:hypothetical protein
VLDQSPNQDLARLVLKRNTLTWLHAGAPRSAHLR